MTKRKRAAALDAALAAMFGALKSRGTPRRLLDTVDELERNEEAAAEPKRKQA
jgi:hypothetical protein